MFQPMALLKKLCYLVAAACFVVLCITGFYPWLVRGEHISGYFMIVHATLAPVFAVCLALLAVTWADRFCFDRTDGPWLRRRLGRVTSPPAPVQEHRRGGMRVTIWKATFWLIVALSIPLILSIVLSMVPLVGTDGQNLLLATHRWVAMVFAVAVIIHTYMAVRVRRMC
jgi:cytochrome b subunit of formate dehydrogenase